VSPQPAFNVSVNSDESDARSTDAESPVTLVHAFVTSRFDYCNSLLAAALETTTNRLQRVLNAAARVVSETKKFADGLRRLMNKDYTGWTSPSESVTSWTC